MHKFLKFSTAALLSASSICNAEIPVDVVPVEQDVYTTQQPYGFTLGPKVRIGLPSGIGAEVALAINQNFVVKANLAYLPETNIVSLSETAASWGLPITKIEALQYQGVGNNLNIMALADWHPFGNSFMLSVGGAYNKAAASVTGKFTAEQARELLSLPSDATPPDLVTSIGVVQTNNFFFVSGIGFDNSNDLESRFNYGVTCDLMWGKPVFAVTQSIAANSAVAAVDQKALDAAGQKLGSDLGTTINNTIDTFVKDKIGLSIPPIPSFTVKFGISLQ